MGQEHPPDRWSEWLGHRRFADDAETRDRLFATLLHPIRDRVLDAAEPIAGSVVLDVGCGDGLIAFGALDRGAASVVFADISQPLLDESRRIAQGRGELDRCSFVAASATALDGVETGSVDAVTLRSVLIYVDDKEAGFREFARVLRPGGRLSLFEPINRFGQREWTGTRFFGADLEPVQEIADKLRDVFRAVLPGDADPLLDFDERDLFDLAERTGFHPVELTLTAEARPADPVRWDVFLDVAGNPNLPTPREAMAVLTEQERERLEAYLRPQIESGDRTRRMAHAYLRAVRA